MLPSCADNMDTVTSWSQHARPALTSIYINLFIELTITIQDWLWHTCAHLDTTKMTSTYVLPGYINPYMNTLQWAKPEQSELRNHCMQRQCLSCKYTYFLSRVQGIVHTIYRSHSNYPNGQKYSLLRSFGVKRNANKLPAYSVQTY